MKDVELYLRDIVYSFKDKEIHKFKVVHVATKIYMDDSKEFIYTIQCMTCEDYMEIEPNDTGVFVPRVGSGCAHVSNRLYTSKKQIPKHAKKILIDSYEHLKNTINIYETQLESIEREIRYIRDKYYRYIYNNIIIIPAVGNKMYGYNDHIYTILEIIESFNIKILKLKCDSCKHENTCIVYVYNKSKNNPNVYDFLSADNDEYAHHHVNTYYTNKVELELTKLKYKHDEVKEYLDRNKQNMELIHTFLPLA